MQLQKTKWTLTIRIKMERHFLQLEIETRSVKFINNNHYLKISSYLYEN